MLHSTLLHLPPLRFWFWKCWNRTQDCCDFGTGSQTPPNQSTRSHQQWRKSCHPKGWAQIIEPSQPFLDIRWSKNIKTTILMILTLILLLGLNVYCMTQRFLIPRLATGWVFMLWLLGIHGLISGFWRHRHVRLEDTWVKKLPGNFRP